MAQIALPFRIALVAVLVIGALWVTVLRPKADDGEPAAAAPAPTAPGAAGLGRAIDKANGAAAASDAANARIQAATGGQAAAAGNASKATPRAAAHSSGGARSGAKPPSVDGVDAGDPSAPLVRALADGKVVVLLFAGSRAVDDRAARRAVRAVPRHRGAVVVKIAPPRAVGKYEAITRGAKVSQFPTVLVIGADKVARPIVGFTTGGEVDQAVSDAVAAARPARHLAVARAAATAHARRTCGAGSAGADCRTYFAQANDACVAMAVDAVDAAVNVAVAGGTPAAVLAQVQASVTQSVAQFAALTPPAAQVAGHKRATALLRADARKMDKLIAGARKAPDPAASLARGARRAQNSKAGKRAAATMRRLGYAACA
jgi:hypothetical protein